MNTFRFPLFVFVSPSMPFHTARRTSITPSSNFRSVTGKVKEHLVLTGCGVHDLPYLCLREPTLLIIWKSGKVWIPRDLWLIHLFALPVDDSPEVLPHIV